ncbi:MAG: hypothetical protein E6Q97_28550 [Desulfurellales bacterium]|nr:MAG: hypothetical protein E6Q97_28550 [Desulfurellales bacterium]
MRFVDHDDLTGVRAVSDQENLADLASRIRPDHRELFTQLKHGFQEAAFFNRRFIIVKCKGKRGNVPRPPEVLGAVRVISFNADHENGCRVVVMDEASSRTQELTHVPQMLFRYPVFAALPAYQGLKWEARELPDGSYKRALVFGMFFKQQSDVKWFNPDNVCVVTHNQFERLFTKPS